MVIYRGEFWKELTNDMHCDGYGIGLQYLSNVTVLKPRDMSIINLEVVMCSVRSCH